MAASGDKKDERYWYYNEPRYKNKTCGLFKISGTTENVKRHLNKVHQRTEKGIRSRDSVLHLQQKAIQQSQFSITTRLNVDSIRKALIQWIIYMHIAFSVVENDYFKAFLHVISPGFELVVPKVGNTIRNWILEAFVAKKEEIRENLRNSKSQINLTFDL